MQCCAPRNNRVAGTAVPLRSTPAPNCGVKHQRDMRYIFLLFVLFGSVCNAEETIVYGIGPIEVESKALVQLRAKSIWYKKHDDGRIEVKTSDLDAVKSTVKDAADSILPPGRSVHYGPQMEAIMRYKLESSGIKYAVKVVGGERWYVWDQKDNDKYKSIETEAQNSLIESLSSGGVK